MVPHYTQLKPEFGIRTTRISRETVRVDEETVMTRPFCRLLHFKRHIRNSDPRVLIIAPLSGHHATLLRGTVEAMLPDHDVYVTDWVDAKKVPLSQGKLDLEDFISYVIDFIRLLGPDVHVFAVCQPAPAVLCAVSLLALTGLMRLFNWPAAASRRSLLPHRCRQHEWP